MKENLKIIWKMEKVKNFGLMVLPLKVISMIIEKMDMVNLNGQMVLHMKVN